MHEISVPDTEDAGEAEVKGFSDSRKLHTQWFLRGALPLLEHRSWYISSISGGPGEETHLR